jgi:hypothetical protein
MSQALLHALHQSLYSAGLIAARLEIGNQSECAHGEVCFLQIRKSVIGCFVLVHGAKHMQRVHNARDKVQGKTNREKPRNQR